jgi:ABC-2 type transport system permease protein
MNAVVVQETLRRHVTNIGYITFLAFVAIIGLGASTFDRPVSMWPSLIWILSVICGAGVIGPEFSSGTLQLVLVKPVNRAVYLLSRVAGVVLAVWLVAGVGAICEIIGRLAWGHAAYAPIGVAFVNLMCEAVLTVSLIALLGSLTRAYFNVAIYLGVMFSFSVGGGILGMMGKVQNAFGRFIADNPVILKVMNVIDQNLFPDLVPRFDRDWTLMVLANAAVALVLACLVFRRREVPYGAD